MFNLLVLCMVSLAHAEYCKTYPGDVKFIHHQVKDESLYLKKYGSEVVNKYRTTSQDHNELYHHLHEVLREDPFEGTQKKSTVGIIRGHGAESSKENESHARNESQESHHEYKAGAHTKEGAHETGGRGKEVSHEMKENHGEEGSHGKEGNVGKESSNRKESSHGKEGSHEKEDSHGKASNYEKEDAHIKELSTVKSSLPIWKLQVPRHTISCNIAKVENGKYIDRFEFNREDFESKNLTTHGPNYEKKLDITPLGINTDAWYVICMNLSVLSKKKETICQHCTLIRASENKEQKVLSAEINEDELMANSAEIEYSVEDIPFPIASIRTKVFLDHGKSSRCLNLEEATTSFESLDPILKDSKVFVEVKNLLESYEYKIDATLELKWNDVPPLGLPSPVEAQFYLRDGKNLKISKCKK